MSVLSDRPSTQKAAEGGPGPPSSTGPPTPVLGVFVEEGMVLVAHF